MKVIFLDVDGVLNSEKYYTEHMEDMMENPVDRECVRRLKQIVDATGAKIVLSSSWRGGWSKESGQTDAFCQKLVDTLAEYQLEIYDKTGNLDHGERGREIRHWIKHAPEKIESFVILDDNDFQWRKYHLWKKWVQTDFSGGGLGEQDVKRAEEILMMKREKNKKNKIEWKRYIGIAFPILFGAVAGFVMGYMAEIGANQWFGEGIMSLIAFFSVIFLAVLIQTVIHELGHLVFGLLSGYRFSSFRIMSFMWIRENGKIKRKRFSLAGTGGQCLMVPPDLVDGKVPVVLYNLGGPLMNLFAGFLFVGGYFAIAKIPFLSTTMLVFAVIGFLLAVVNGVPMHMGMVDNDGYNAFSLIRNDRAMLSFWIQMKINEQTSKGIRIKDMPEEWFFVPSDEEMKNSLIAAIGVFTSNRLMDEHRFEEADRLIEHLLEIGSGLVSLYRNLMVCDRMYIEMLRENRREVLDGMLTKEQKKFMKAMKQYPSVLRTEYVYALLADRDMKKVKKVLAQFEMCAKKYPYPNETQSEWELMEIAEKKIRG